MILVDTSVMISFLSGKVNVQTEKFEFILKNEIRYGINNYIYQELLQGARTEEEFTILKEYLETQIFYELLHGRNSYLNAAVLYSKCRRSGITVRSTIDLLIVETAIENELLLLHNDNDFINIAKVAKKLEFY